MNSLIENIQLLFICHKEKDAELYQNALNKVKDVEIRLDDCYSKLEHHLKSLRNYLKEANDEINENLIGEDELNKITCFFEKGFETHENQIINEVFFSTIEPLENDDCQNRKISNKVYQKLISNVEDYYQSPAYQHVSFGCLYFLLYYIYKVEYKGRKNLFEKKYNLENFLDDNDIEANNLNTKEENHVNSELKSLKYLKKYLNHDNVKIGLRTHILCRHINISLSLDKMLYFITQTLEQNEKDNLVIFIGVTGSGKSTIINNLCGTEYEKDALFSILVPKKGSYNRVKIADENAIYSETLFCETVKYEDDDKKVLNFYDTPGFNDVNSNVESSIVASLGFPLLIKTAQKIKAIVIVINYDLFEINTGGKGQNFEAFSQNIMQMFKNFNINSDNFKSNQSKLNFFFAISKPDATQTKENLNKIIKWNLERFQKRIKNEKAKFDTCKKSLEFIDFEIELYKSYIKQLESMKEGHYDVDFTQLLNTTFNNFKNYFFKNNNNENFVENGEDETNLNQFERIKANLEQELKRVKEKQSNINDKLKIWQNSLKELEKEKRDADNYINGYISELLMIDLVKDAFETKRIFFLPCCESKFDDKQLFLDELKSYNDENNIDKSLFSFNSEQETFNKVKVWADKIANNTNSRIETITSIINKINEMDHEIKYKHEFISICKSDLNRLLRPTKAGIHFSY